MNAYSDNDINANMENNRNSLRRIARHEEPEFSNQSIFNAMEKFVKSVNTMDETILIPCRLMDLKVGDEQDASAKQTSTTTTTKSKQTINNLLNSADLFDVYHMLNTIKDNLVWGEGQSPDFDDDAQVPPKATVTPATTPAASAVTTTTPASQTQQKETIKGHVRRPSTVSVSSTNSSASSISDSDSEAAEIDSGIDESAADIADRTAQVAHNFRRHLHGLTRSLRQLTDAAQYLTTRYQHDIGSPL